MSWKVEERRKEKELKRTKWHQGKTDQVSAPLLLDPAPGEMTRDMKEVCRKFEEVTGWRISVNKRAGNSVRSIAKAEPLKEKDATGWIVFPAVLVEETVRGMVQATGLSTRPASWLEFSVCTKLKLEVMVTSEERSTLMP